MAYRNIQAYIQGLLLNDIPVILLLFYLILSVVGRCYRYYNQQRVTSMYTCLSARHLLTKISIALERSDRDKRGETCVKFNWSCIKRVTLSGDITAKFIHIACNYYHFAYARLSLIVVIALTCSRSKQFQRFVMEMRIIVIFFLRALVINNINN